LEGGGVKSRDQGPGEQGNKEPKSGDPRGRVGEGVG